MHADCVAFADRTHGRHEGKPRSRLLSLLPDIPLRALDMKALSPGFIYIVVYLNYDFSYKRWFLYPVHS